MDGGAGGGDKVGDVFVTVVEIEESVEKLAKDKGAGGDGLGGVPRWGPRRRIGLGRRW